MECNGCGKPVVRPIRCRSCGLAIHPGCLNRSNHLVSNGQLLDCSILSQASRSDSLEDDQLFVRIQNLFLSQFESLRAEIRELKDLYMEDIDKLTLDVSSLTEWLYQLELKFSQLPSHSLSEETILQELADRESRSRNIIVSNIEEQPQPNHSQDLERIRSILNSLCPGDYSTIRVSRIGKKQQSDRHRLIRVTLSTKSDALIILRNKNRYNGPARIY